jgi:hypothetical protein
VVLIIEGPTPAIKDPWGNQRVGGQASTKINRKDFGLVWNAALESGGVVVGDEVEITIDVENYRKPGGTPDGPPAHRSGAGGLPFRIPFQVFPPGVE